MAAKGWYILNKGDKLPDEDETMPSGYHMLVTTEAPKPTFLFRALKRSGRLAAGNFGELKAVYDFRCATCGSQEGKPHFIEPDKRTALQQGHMDPFAPLSLKNTIPQCQICNQVYQDRYVFDEKGRVTAVANIEPVRAAKPQVQDQIRNFLGGK